MLMTYVSPFKANTSANWNAVSHQISCRCHTSVNSGDLSHAPPKQSAVCSTCIILAPPANCQFIWMASTTIRTGMQWNAVPILFYTMGTSFPLFFFCILQLLTVIFNGSPSVINLIHLLLGFMHVNNNSICYRTLKNGWHMVIWMPMTISQESVTQRKNRATAI